MDISLGRAAELLRNNDNILILTHRYPDGDTLGSGFALYYILTRLGKRARLLCADKIPAKYACLYENYKESDFEPDFIVSVDVADTKLLGRPLMQYADKVDLCIDHHGTNIRFAKESYVEHAAAATELVYDIMLELGVELDALIGACIYTGLSTDTGCFRYSNTTAKTHILASECIKASVDTAQLNKIYFETKSMARLEIERQALLGLRYYYNNTVAIMSFTREMLTAAGAQDSDLEGITTIPRQIEGVLIGVTIKERERENMGRGDTASRLFEISVRTSDGHDAAKLCGKFGGGGHKCAAGCAIEGSLEDVTQRIVSTLGEFIGEL